jgi:2-phospho-L-lactate guanylyltransferase
VQWTVLLPAKALPEAKSRLVPASASPADHRALVDAIRHDTAAAARGAANVARLLVVVDRGEPAAEVIVQRRPGLNAALEDAAAIAAERWPGDGVAALVGDLPALRSAELADALQVAARHDRGYVADHQGTGTTLLTAAPGVGLRPRFGTASAARHGAEAVLLPAGPGLRHDVDTAADLEAAATLGVGVATAAVLGKVDVVVSSPCPGMMG